MDGFGQALESEIKKEELATKSRDGSGEVHALPRAPWTWRFARGGVVAIMGRPAAKSTL